MRFSTISLLLLLTCLSPLSIQAAVYEYSADPRGSANYLSADFRCWIPDTSEPIRGVLVIVPQQDADGRDQVNIKAYQEKCKKWNFALVGCYYTGGTTKFYTNPRGGSALALIEAIRSFSDQSDRRELFKAHMAVVGLSAGAQFAFGMACDQPDRVIAFVSNKGVYFQARPVGATYDVPGLFIVGERDETASKENTQKLFNQGRARGALWATTTAEREEHELGNATTISLYLDYLETAIEVRLNKQNYANTLEKLKPWDGVFLSMKTSAMVKGDDRDAERNSDLSWLPTTEFAQQLLDSNRHTPVKK